MPASSVSRDAVIRLLKAMRDEDNEDDDDVRASFAYELAKEKIDDYEQKAEKIFARVANAEDFGLPLRQRP